MRIQNAMTLVTGTVILGLITACSPSTSTKVLTTSSAKSILANHYTANPSYFDFVYATAYLKEDLNKPTTRDYEQESSDSYLMKGLLQAGYLSQSQRMSTVPEVSGSYSAQTTSKRGGILCKLSLRMSPSSAKVAGRFNEKTQASTSQIAVTGSITGWVEPDGTVYLAYHPNPTRELKSKDHTVYAEYTFYRSNGSPVLRGKQPLLFPPNNHNNIAYRTMTFSGNGPKGYIKVPLYTYTFTKKLQSFVPINPPSSIWNADIMEWMWLKPRHESDGKTALRKGMGSLTVDKVSNLLLDSDVKAHATYSWHIRFNNLGRLFAGKNSEGRNNTVTGNGEVYFRKRPDGSWVFNKCKIAPNSIKLDSITPFPGISRYLVTYPFL